MEKQSRDQAGNIQWAPRIKQQRIRQLYENDAHGLHDEELMDEVGWGLLARCQSFIDAVNAVRGKARCHLCGEIILHGGKEEEILHCPRCGWEIAWVDYFKTIQHKQLSGADAVMAFFQDFIDRFPQAQTPQEKMLCIDQLIHSFHINLVYGATRAAGVNLIEGRYHEVVDFLNRLSYGEGSTPGTLENRSEWRKTITDTGAAWHDEKLKSIGDQEQV